MELFIRSWTRPSAYRCICTQRILRNGLETSEGIDSMSDQPAEDQMSKNAASHSHRKAFVKWLKSKGRQYEAAPNVPGTNYLDGKNHPFPLNPQFQPQAPLAPKIKDEVYEDWCSGVGLRQLSQKYGISLERIEAILKLQEIRSRWATEGKEVMSSYATSMSLMLGTSENQSSDYEARTNISIDPGRQMFTLIAEAEDYTPKDAAKELDKVPFSERKEAQLQKFLSRSKYEHTSAFGKLVDRNIEDSLARETANVVKSERWSYKIRNSESSDVLLRDKSGVLSQKPRERVSDTSMLLKWSR